MVLRGSDIVGRCIGNLTDAIFVRLIPNVWLAFKFSSINVVETVLGEKFAFTISSIKSYRRVKSLRTKEPLMLQFIQRTGSNNRCFIDVGANIGLFSVIASRFFRYVIAVEPNPLNTTELFLNLRPFENANLMMTSVSATECITELYLLGNTIGESMANIETPTQYLKQKGFKKVLTGSADWDHFGKIYPKDTEFVIKIDVDGIEHILFDELMKSALLARLRGLAIEVNEHNIFTKKLVRQEMARLGMIELFEDTPRVDSESLNLYFLKR